MPGLFKKCVNLMVWRTIYRNSVTKQGTLGSGRCGRGARVVFRRPGGHCAAKIGNNGDNIGNQGMGNVGIFMLFCMLNLYRFQE